MGLKDQLAVGAAAAAVVGLYVFLTRRKGRKDVRAVLQFQHPTNVPRSLTTTGKVYVDRSTTGSDAPSVGLEYAPKKVLLRDGRGEKLTLDDNGMLFTRHEGIEGIDFYNEDDIIGKYYPMMERLLMEKTGAKRVIVFDHNVRKTLTHHKEGGDRIKGGNQVQHPLQMVHGDYTLTSAPLRIRMLSDKPKTNDTLAKVLNGKPVVDPKELPQILSGRYQFVNVWRSFADTPILDQPLAVCDGSSVPPEDLVVFEVRYTDRTGENYFSRHSQGHKWYHFPQGAISPGSTRPAGPKDPPPRARSKAPSACTRRLRTPPRPRGPLPGRA